MAQNNLKNQSFDQKKRILRPAKYAKISYQNRLQLINAIENQKLTIKEAAKSLQINESTAKFIYKCYKMEGKIFQTKEDKAKREIIEKYQRQQHIQPPQPYTQLYTQPNIQPPLQTYLLPNYQPVLFTYFYPS